jgi:hypothetical protein
MSSTEEVWDYVESFKTIHRQGFVISEIHQIIEHFSSKYKLNMDKYYGAMRGNTCMVINEEIITYHCDLGLALCCAIENREQTVDEWD